MHVAAALAGIEEERKGKALLGADWPSVLERFDLSFRPRADFVGFWPLDAKRRVVLEQSNVDSMLDQHAEHFQDREGCAGSVSIGLEDAGIDPLARQPCNAAVAVFGTQCLEPAGIASLRRVPQADIGSAPPI